MKELTNTLRMYAEDIHSATGYNDCSSTMSKAADTLDRLNKENADLAASGHRLALELECLLMDCKDLPTVSKWFDTAHEAMAEWRELITEQIEDAKSRCVDDEMRIGCALAIEKART